jgi:hypothetical protein
MNPCHAAVGSTVTVVAALLEASAKSREQEAMAKLLRGDFIRHKFDSVAFCITI